ncbi:hypothetical protein AVEN_233161-1 [Araneus ventricosus]|uniref:Uncharacterized protein n=1 Tax=Araneus ventricosus TaxID=182803 RepID=A0A4Y2EK09_ARAVE|nr:hypothetical protein AVEN_233161-1 [Araneus ventricosus]
MLASLQNLAARIGFWQTAKFSEYPFFVQAFTHAHGVEQELDILCEMENDDKEDDDDDTDPSQSLLTSQEPLQDDGYFFQAFHPQMMISFMH